MKTQHRHSKTATDRRRRTANGSVVIQITTNTEIIVVLDEVVKTGFFGNSRATAAERLLAEALRQMLKEGIIQKRKNVLK